MTAAGLGTHRLTGTIDCTALENAMSGADAKTIDLTASFFAGASPVASPAPEPSAESVAPDTLHLVTTGDVPVASPAPEPFVESGTGTELVLADDAGNTARITFDIDSSAEPPLTNAFIAFGLPGSSIFDPTFFPDALRTQCVLTPDVVDATTLSGTFACTDLSSGDGTKTIDATGSFSVTR